MVMHLNLKVVVFDGGEQLTVMLISLDHVNPESTQGLVFARSEVRDGDAGWQELRSAWSVAPFWFHYQIS